MCGGLARRPGRGGFSRGARAPHPRGGAPIRPAPPQQPVLSGESRKASGDASFSATAAQVCGDVAQQRGLDASAGAGQGAVPVPSHGDREVSRVGGKARTCSRCSQKGHGSADCAVELYCDICDAHGDHVNHRCPVLKLPRPSAHAVGYSVEGLGFYHIPHPPLSRKKDSKTALIKVVGGTLSLEQIVTQLQRIVLGKWKWEPVQQSDGSFVVVFPSKVELQRSIAYGGTDVRDNGVSTGLRLEFEEWHGKEEGFLLPKVWIRVYGIRKKLREFLNLWAIGSMVGSTQTVDMKTTRKSNFGRILVAVLDPNLVPAKLDVVIGDHYFELRFEKEQMGFDENGDEVELNSQDGDDKDNDSMEDEVGDEDQNFSRTAKRSKGDDMIVEANGSTNCISGGTAANTLSGARAEALEDKIKRLAEEIVDMAVNNSIDKCCDLVTAESEDEMVAGRVVDAVSDGQAGLLTEEPELPFLAAAVPRESEAEDRPLSVEAARKPQKPPAAGALSAAAGVKAVLATPTRSSPRLAGAFEEHVLDKARKRAALKNLEPMKGKNPNSSFLSFSDAVVQSSLNSIGVALGNRDSEVLDSIRCLKSIEAKRLPPTLSSKEMGDQRSIAVLDNEEDDDLDNITLGHLCGDLMEEVMDEDSDHLSCDFQAVFKKNKSKSSSRKKKLAKIRMARRNRNGSP
jgi:hypothetical protein